MPNPTLVSDLAVRFRALSTEEGVVAQALLDDAWVILLSRTPGLEDRMSAGSVSDALVRAVVSAMVLRVLRNPDGVRQWSVDDYSETRDSSLAAGALYVSDDELTSLAPEGSASTSAAFTIRPAGAGAVAWDGRRVGW